MQRDWNKQPGRHTWPARDGAAGKTTGGKTGGRGRSGKTGKPNNGRRGLSTKLDFCALGGVRVREVISNELRAPGVQATVCERPKILGSIDFCCCEPALAEKEEDALLKNAQTTAKWVRALPRGLGYKTLAVAAAPAAPSQCFRQPFWKSTQGFGYARPALQALVRQLLRLSL